MLTTPSLRTAIEVSDDLDELQAIEEARWPALIDQALSEGIVSLFDGDDDGDSAADDAADDDDAAADGSDADDSGDDADDDDDSDDDSEPGDSDAVKAARAAQKAAEQAAARERKARKAADRKLKAREEKDREDSGEWEQLSKQKDEEIEGLKSQLRDGAFDRTVQTVAGRLRFRDPEDARLMVGRDLREDAVDEDYEVDEPLVEKALKALAKRKPHLVEPEKDRQSDVKSDQDGQNGNNGLDDSERTFGSGLEAAMSIER